MRILLVHNYYRSGVPSGENTSVDLEVEGLRAGGHDVKVFGRSSDQGLGSVGAQLQAARHAVGSRAVAQQFRDTATEFEPDVVHLENLFPFISPVVVVVAKELGIPVVASVRNFRLSCPVGTHRRVGISCFECSESRVRLEAPALRHGCYQNRRVRTMPIVIGRWRYREGMRSLDHYLPVSGYMADYLRDIVGIEDSRITVCPNGGHSPASSYHPVSSRKLLYAGRLTEDKGVLALVDAWRSVASGSGWSLVLAGSGDLEAQVRYRACEEPSISVLGHCPPGRMRELYEEAAAIAVPSLWDEPFGRTVIEAFEYGRPVLATTTGGLGDLVDESVGWPAAPDLGGITEGLKRLFATSQVELERKSLAAAERYDHRFTPAMSVAALVRVYEAVAAHREC